MTKTLNRRPRLTGLARAAVKAAKHLNETSEAMSELIRELKALGPDELDKLGADRRAKPKKTETETETEP